MRKLDQRGVVHLLVPIILLLGLIAGVYLVTSGKSLNLFSRASTPPIVFKALDGRSLPVNENGVYQTNEPDVKVELTSPLGGPESVSGPVSVSGPNNKGTVAYRIGFDLDELGNAVFIPYVNEPTIFNASFKNKEGIQFLWVEFKDVDGQLDKRSAQIEIVMQNDATPTPSPSFSSTPIPSLTPKSESSHRSRGGWSRPSSPPSWGGWVERWGGWLKQRWERPADQPTNYPGTSPDRSQDNTSD